MSDHQINNAVNPSTVFALMYEFGTAHIPVVDMARKYFGLNEQEAKRAARDNKFPFPVFRAGSNKTPWLVDAVDLAAYLDKVKEKAKKQFREAKLEVGK
ncbi:pyocin activator PrtN family protein [Methylobacter sp. sgz302048]|uniref:pyocin activator PrtN family protein n=1 Tax=Methylobacter sp. sgz302048 TaxID=3455945 RepID=UPI003F9F43DC